MYCHIFYHRHNVTRHCVQLFSGCFICCHTVTRLSTLHHNCAKVCNFRGCLGLVLRRIGESAKLFPDLQLIQTRGLMTGTKLGISVSSCGSSKTFHLEVSLETFIEKMNKITFPSKMPINVTNFNPTAATKSKLYYCPTC